jgi:hypothetical protein
MLNHFVFSYEGAYYRCLALPFGWGHSALHAPFVRYLRNVCGYRVLVYLDDTLLVPKLRRAATEADCWAASKRVDYLLRRFGIARHPDKDTWGGGATRLVHLGVVFDMEMMAFFVPEKMIRQMRQMVGSLLCLVGNGRRWVRAGELATVCGTAISLSLAVLLAHFHTRALYHALATSAGGCLYGKAEKVRLKTDPVRDLRFWRKLDGQGRPMHHVEPEICVHSDAADVRWGGTIGNGMEAGQEGAIRAQGIWMPEERRETIV